MTLDGAAYPTGAREARAEAICNYSLEVDASGAVSRVIAVQCTSDAFDFAGAIRRHIQTVWPNRPFRPAIVDGVEATTRVSGEHTFSLSNR